MKKYSKIKDVKYSKDEVRIKWYYDGTLNASANCIDRHLKESKKLLLSGLVTTRRILKRFLIKNYIKMYVKQQTDLKVSESKKVTGNNLSDNDT